MFADFITNTIGMFKDFFTNTVGMFKDMWTNVSSAVSDGISKVIDWFSGIGDRVMTAIGDVGSLLVNAGGSIIDGFLKGLKQGFEDVKNFVGGIGDWIAKNKGPEAYDRALLIPHGGWIIGGLQKGIEDSMGGLKSTLTEVTDLVSSAVSGSISVNVGSGINPGNSNPNVFATAVTSNPLDLLAAANAQRGAGMVTNPTVNVYPSAPLNEQQVGIMAAKQLYFDFTNR
jgi:phage-related protein